MSDEPEQGWRTVDVDPVEQDLGLATAWTWPVERDSGERSSIRVRISSTAMSSDDVPPIVEEARATRGRSVLERVLAVTATWAEPVRDIVLNTRTREPVIITASGDELPGFPC